MPVYRLNTIYAYFLIAIAAIVLLGTKLDFSTIQQYSAVLLAGFGIVLLPMSTAMRKNNSTARLISLGITAMVGIVALLLLMKVQLLSSVAEPSLIITSVMSFVLVGFYLAVIRKK